MTDRVCIVTGANSGIGKEIARGLAARRAKVVMICRNHIRGETAQQEIQKSTGNDNLQLFLADLSSLASVRAVAEQLLQRIPRIDVLVHNAGLINGVRRETTDGLEYTFAVNHLAPFLLTALLLDRLRATPGARIVNVSSRAHTKGFLDVTDLQMERSYDPWRAYRASKLAQVLFTYGAGAPSPRQLRRHGELLPSRLGREQLRTRGRPPHPHRDGTDPASPDLERRGRPDAPLPGAVRGGHRHHGPVFRGRARRALFADQLRRAAGAAALGSEHAAGGASPA